MQSKKFSFFQPSEKECELKQYCSETQSFGLNNLTVIVHPDSPQNERMDAFHESMKADEEYYKKHPPASGQVTMKIGMSAEYAFAEHLAEQRALRR